MKITSFLLIFFLLFSFSLTARDVLRECDTLITQTGQVLLVQIEQMTDSTITYRYCGSASDVPPEIHSADFVRQIKKGSIKNGMKKMEVDMNAPASYVESQKATPAELRKAKKYAKMALFFSIGSIFLWLFTALFSTYAAILILPVLIVGLIYSSYTLKATRRKMDLSRYRAVGIVSMILCTTQLVFAFLYLLALLIFLALIF